MFYVVNSNVDLFNVGDKVLTNEDRNDIRAFNLLVNSGMSRGSYNYMRFMFRNQLSVASICHLSQGSDLSRSKANII